MTRVARPRWWTIPPWAYKAGRVRLLLLLSALLAALTGASAEARAPRAEAVAVAVELADAAPLRAHAHVLLTARPGGEAVIAAPPAPPAFELRGAPKLWLQRRRE